MYTHGFIYKIDVLKKICTIDRTTASTNNLQNFKTTD